MCTYRFNYLGQQCQINRKYESPQLIDKIIEDLVYDGLYIADINSKRDIEYPQEVSNTFREGPGQKLLIKFIVENRINPHPRFWQCEIGRNIQNVLTYRGNKIADYYDHYLGFDHNNLHIKYQQRKANILRNLLSEENLAKTSPKEKTNIFERSKKVLGDILNEENTQELKNEPQEPVLNKPIPQKKLEDREPRVYFIQDTANQRIKIGRSVTPDKRKSEFQTGSSNNLRVLAYIPGDYSLEKELQTRFSKDKIDGEWYYNSKELLQFILDNATIISK